MYFFFSMRLLNNCVAVFLVFLLVYLLDFGTSCGTEHFGTFCCAKIDFCIKCIFASNRFLQSIKCIFASNAFCRFLTFCKQNVRAASNAFLHQMHFCIKYIFALPFFFAVQKTQQYQIHFCTKCIFCS